MAITKQSGTTAEQKIDEEFDRSQIKEPDPRVTTQPVDPQITTTSTPTTTSTTDEERERPEKITPPWLGDKRPVWDGTGPPPYGHGPGQTVVPPPPPPSTGVDEEPDEPTVTDVDARGTVEGLLDDPNTFLQDRDLEQQYTEHQVTEEEIQDPFGNQLGDLPDVTAETVEVPGQAEAAEAVSAGNISAALINPDDLTKAVDEIEKLDPMKAASMSKHLDELLDGMEEGNVPLWARPAVTKVEQLLASRGISASSVGRDSLFNAIIQAAMPIAQQDAAFEQEAYKVNYQAKVQAVLSDVNMEFAAKQFNANSKNQVAQFNAQLETQVALQNAARADAMTQFNEQMKMSGEQFNASQTNAMTQMTVQLQSQREQFNAQLSSQIEQSNVNWRRQVNSANTAGINAVNQANVQNAFNLSNQALTFLWQEMRDEAHWEFQATEAEKDRKAQLEASILANETAMGGEIGATIESIINGSRFLGNFLDSWG